MKKRYFIPIFLLIGILVFTFAGCTLWALPYGAYCRCDENGEFTGYQGREWNWIISIIGVEYMYTEYKISLSDGSINFNYDAPDPKFSKHYKAVYDEETKILTVYMYPKDVGLQGQGEELTAFYFKKQPKEN